MLNSGLAKFLGFSRKMYEPGKDYTSDKPHRLAVYREIGVHLAEVSSLDNLHNGHPSTLLSSVPVENEKWLWLTLVTLKGSIEAERKTSFTLSSCLMWSTKEKGSPPLRV